MKELFLASSSLARIKLFEQLKIPFRVDKSEVDETPLPYEKGPELVKRLSQAKAEACLKKHPDALCLGADTVAWLDDKILGKPTTSDQAKEMLQALSGRQHIMLTGISLVTQKCGEWALGHTLVTFRELSDREIEDYIGKGEWLGRAAGYAIQEGIDFLVKIEGSRTNVIGLPMELLCEKLRIFGIDCSYCEE